jgi:hypothetical protein
MAPLITKSLQWCDDGLVGKNPGQIGVQTHSWVRPGKDGVLFIRQLLVNPVDFREVGAGIAEVVLKLPKPAKHVVVRQGLTVVGDHQIDDQDGPGGHGMHVGPVGGEDVFFHFILIERDLTGAELRVCGDRVVVQGLEEIDLGGSAELGLLGEKR